MTLPVPTFVYVGPFDVVDIPLIGRSVKAGEEFDVSDAQAALLAEQPDNYAPAPVKKKV
jgi:hypothetical protein